MTLRVVPDIPAQDPGVRLVARESRREGLILRTTVCRLAGPGATLLEAADVRGTVEHSSDEVTIVRIPTVTGLICVRLCLEMIEDRVVSLSRTASVLQHDGSWLEADIQPLGPYLVVRWPGGVAMLAGA